MSLDTIADLVRYNCGLRAHCLPCRKPVMLDLEALIREGRGELPYMQTRVRCSQCGEIGSMQLIPLSTLGGRSQRPHTVPE